MKLLVPLFLLHRYASSCASTSSANSPVTTSTEGPTTTTTTGTSTSTSITTTTTTSTTTTTTLGCPAGWSLHNTNCFMFVNTAVNGITAAQNCAALGATLASIHSQDENDFVNAITLGMLSWIGIVHGDQNPTTFQWSDGSAWGPYTNWRAAGEPSLLFGENCGVINVVGGSGTWDDATCSLVLPYVCEMAATGG